MTVVFVRRRLRSTWVRVEARNSRRDREGRVRVSVRSPRCTFPLHMPHSSVSRVSPGADRASQRGTERREDRPNDRTTERRAKSEERVCDGSGAGPLLASKWQRPRGKSRHVLTPSGRMKIKGEEPRRETRREPAVD